MTPVIDKNQMSEEDIKLYFITPAIQVKGWKGFITMETKITAGKVNLHGNIVVREKPKKVDYLLYIRENQPIAVVEAKKNDKSISFGLQQAKEYAEKLDLPFAYSSNGDGFEEYDYLTGLERTIGLDEFPTRDELIARYYMEMNHGAGITETEKLLQAQPYYSSQDTYPPRFYQRIAINRTLDAIALGQQRILLVMATGTGKTYTAFQIVYRLLKSGMKAKILYLADRNILVDQSIEQDFKPLNKTIHKIDYSEDIKVPGKVLSHEVYFALYQQLIGDHDEKHYAELFRPGFFDLVIVDECHRGSAKDDSKWREILDYFSGATQIGMTATPKESKYVSNLSYFGDPVYTYSLNEGIEDGFLANFKVIEPRMNIGDGWRPYKGQKDIFGEEIEDRIYNNTDYDYNIVIEDRIHAVAKDITDYLKSTGRMQKTIVFCADEPAAERMRKELSNLNKDMMKNHPDYVVRITGSDDYGKSKLDYFISIGQDYPVIATTSELLSTGVDTKTVKVIAIDKNISSMTAFKQTIGRGTRIVEKKGKLSFVVMDFRGVSRLFADPDWDGPIEIDPDYVPGGHGDPDVPPPDPDVPPADPDAPPDVPPVDPPTPRYKPIVDKDGCKVEIIQKTVSIYDPHGKLLRQESIIDYTKTNIQGEYGSLDQFIRYWSGLQKKDVITELLKDRGIDLEALKKDQRMEDVDDYDFICHVAFDQKPLTRAERAGKVKRSDFFSKYIGAAREVLEALLDRYMNLGITEMESTEILKLDPFAKYGKPAKIAGLFGGPQGYYQALQELEKALYGAA